MLDLSSGLYLAAIIGIAALVFYSGRKQYPPRSNRKR